MIWTSSDVAGGDEVLASQYNELRADTATVLTSAVPIGTVLLWAGTDANLNTGWLVCDGSAINRTTYSDLYTIQGNAFGAGDGSTTFNIPDMRDRFVVGAGSSYAQNAQGGASTNNMAHTHTVNSHTHTTGTHSHTVTSHRHSTPNHSHGAGTYRARIMRASQYQMYMYQASSTGWTANVMVNLYNSSSNSTAQSTGVVISGSSSSAGASNTGYSAPTTNAVSAGTTGGTGLTSNSSGSATQENKPPYIGIFYIIKAL